MTPTSHVDAPQQSTRLERHKAFLKKRSDPVGKGFAIGCLNAASALFLYWWQDDGKELSRGIEAVFSVETQVFLFVMLMGTLLFVPLIPRVLRLSIFIYDAFLFGLSFLFINALLFSVVSLIGDEPERVKYLLIGQGIIFIVASLVFVTIGPFTAEEIEDYVTSKGRWRAFGGKFRNWLLFYAVWVAAIVTATYFGSVQIQKSLKQTSCECSELVPASPTQ
ncbi:hypothetical protein [uncultured Ruegeria sp.]|uniref:hypothetical protein n=1 Tax=uncultured Ruegeria sp. TaxID=259304 RepID=UPI00262B5195|nr:hypothetical protein [uncultured Ruegeria sp.]